MSSQKTQTEEKEVVFFALVAYNKNVIIEHDNYNKNVIKNTKIKIKM